MEWLIWFALATAAGFIILFSIPAIRHKYKEVLRKMTFEIVGEDELVGAAVCKRCGRKWDKDQVHPHVTHYERQVGCFALCEKCWSTLETPDARLPFYIQLWSEWTHIFPAESVTLRLQIETAVKRGL